MRKALVLCIAFLVSVGIVFISDSLQAKSLDSASLRQLQGDDAIISQEAVLRPEGEHGVFMIYEKDRLLGVLHDDKKLDALLDRVYTDRYENDFPNTELGLGEDIYTTETLSMFDYEDKDEEILQYLDEHDAFSVNATRISFSNGAILYVKNIEDFYAARDEYVLNFVDKESYDLLKNNQKVPELADGEYGDRVVSADYIQTASVSNGLAPVNKIAKTKEEVISYLSYGYDAEPVIYKTVEYDTVQGVAWLEGIKVEQLLANNTDKLTSANQILQVGTELDVTPLNSPIQFSVTIQHKEKKEILPGEPEIIEDPTLREGKEEIIQYAESGSKNVIIEETLINGIGQGGTEISSITTKEPVREIRKVGTYIEPRIGSGRFVWPVENPVITCAQGCYYGHMGTDIQNRYNLYGHVLAADRGVIEINSYHPINGYYYVINHNNGYWTYYGHMARPGFMGVGEVVAQGEVIGDIGMTGLASGPHVHFEIRSSGGMMGHSLPFYQFFR